MKSVSEESGFTLLELVIIVVMIGIFLPAALITMQSGVVQENRDHISQQQLAVAEATLEEIMSDRYAPGRGVSHITQGNYGQIPGLSGITRQVSVQEIRYQGRPGKSVTVSVSASGSQDITIRTTFLENW
jgi:type II secretory pathway pseudopilin PulG